MLVLRIEDEEGMGPWSGRAYPWGKCECDHFYEKICPDVHDDCNLSYKDMKSRVCGLQSYDLYDHWFHAPHRTELNKAKYHLSIYKIHKNSVKMGKYQCAFHKEKAVLLKKYDPTNLKDIEEFLKKGK